MRFAIAVLTVVTCLGTAGHATELPRRIGMFPTTGGAALAMLDSKIDVAIRGPIVEAVVTQTFRNDSDRVTEATYIFPLPADAAVSAMSITTGARTIHASIEKRAEAQKRYEQAVAAGVRAATLEQERPDIFTQTVSAIPARGSVQITLRYDTVARYRAGTWELAVPLVVAPRFVPGTASGRPTTGVGRAPDTDRAPDASRVTPGGAPNAGGKTELTIEFVEAVEAVTSPSHEITGNTKSWRLTDPRSDHDAIVRWRAPVQVGGWVEQDPDGGYAAIVVEAGAPTVRKPGMVHYTLMLDRAATMRGDADAVMHPLVRALLGKLAGSDRVTVVGSDKVGASTPADALRAIEAAWTRPAGAFDLTKVLSAAKSDGSAVVLVSDGLVADDAAAVAAAAKLGMPVHVIGVGPAPNRSLLGAIASASGGTIRFAGTADDLAGIAAEVIADVANPPAPVVVTWGTLGASELVPAILPRLGAGQAMLVLARVKQAQRANGRARNELFAITTVSPQRVTEGAMTPRGVLARRWARDRLDELLARRDATATTAHALRYGLVSPYTTMVAIGDEVVVEGGVKHSVSVPVSVPAGMRWQEVSRQVRVSVNATKGEETVKDEPRNIPKTTKTADKKPAENKPVADKGPRDRDPVATRRPVVVTVDRPVTPAPPPAQTQPRGGNDETESGADDDGEDVSAKPAKKHARDDDNAPEPRSPTSTGSVASAERLTDVEELQVSDTGSSRRLKLRLALSLGGGVAYAGSATSLVALDGRFEVGHLTLAGLDTSLWLVDGLHVEGRVLASVARRGIQRIFELGGALGVHITGDGFGPAASLSLRVRPHARGFGGFLRYDGALVNHGTTRTGENAGTVGLEYTW